MFASISQLDPFNLEHCERVFAFYGGLLSKKDLINMNEAHPDDKLARNDAIYRLYWRKAEEKGEFLIGNYGEGQHRGLMSRLLFSGSNLTLECPRIVVNTLGMKWLREPYGMIDQDKYSSQRKKFDVDLDLLQIIKERYNMTPAVAKDDHTNILVNPLTIQVFTLRSLNEIKAKIGKDPTAYELSETIIRYSRCLRSEHDKNSKLTMLERVLNKTEHMGSNMDKKKASYVRPSFKNSPYIKGKNYPKGFKQGISMEELNQQYPKSGFATDTAWVKFMENPSDPQSIAGVVTMFRGSESADKNWYDRSKTDDVRHYTHDALKTYKDRIRKKGGKVSDAHSITGPFTNTLDSMVENATGNGVGPDKAFSINTAQANQLIALAHYFSVVHDGNCPRNCEPIIDLLVRFQHLAPSHGMKPFLNQEIARLLKALPVDSSNFHDPNTEATKYGLLLFLVFGMNASLLYNADLQAFSRMISTVNLTTQGYTYAETVNLLGK